MVLSDLTAFDVATGDYGVGSYDFAHKELARVENEHPCTCQIKARRNQEARMGSPMSGYPSLIQPADLDPDCELHFPWRLEDDAERRGAMRWWMAGYHVGFGTGGAGVREELVEADPEVQGLMLREWGAGAEDLERVLSAFASLQDRVETALGGEDPEVAGSLEAAALLGQWAAAARAAEGAVPSAAGTLANPVGGFAAGTAVRFSPVADGAAAYLAVRVVLPDGSVAVVHDDDVLRPADEDVEAPEQGSDEPPYGAFAAERDGSDLIGAPFEAARSELAARAVQEPDAPVAEAAAVRAAIGALGVSGAEVAAAVAGDLERWPADRCEDCGLPCLWVETVGDWRHVDPAARCFLIQTAWGGAGAGAVLSGDEVLGVLEVLTDPELYVADPVSGGWVAPETERAVLAPLRGRLQGLEVRSAAAERVAPAASDDDGETVHGIPSDTADALLAIAGLERDGEGRYGGRYWDRGEALRDALIVIGGRL